MTLADLSLANCIAILVGSSATAVGWLGLYRTRQLKIEINHRMTELLELTRQAAHAAGKLEEKEEQAKGM
jgi:hypothetical protein